MTPASVYHNEINFNKNINYLKKRIKTLSTKRTLIVALYI